MENEVQGPQLHPAELLEEEALGALNTQIFVKSTKRSSQGAEESQQSQPPGNFPQALGHILLSGRL